MGKVDETGQMVSDAPDQDDDTDRGGKKIGDPALKHSTESGGRARVSDKLSHHPDAPGVLPGEKPSI
jgi:hypothetical protein